MNSKKQDTIKPINKDAVHKICSGQVVLNLAIAVKELVENALDADAKNIEVRVVNYGLDSIEVIDNGKGVKEENFEALTLKHYTSKIEQFDDLESVSTLGFRGEALSSLCALTDLSIITRHSCSDHAFHLKYDHKGAIKSKEPTARPIGTTVSISNLFCNLPVRRKEFTKNYKKEFSKMCSILYAYCLVSKNVKFTCSHKTNQQMNMIFSTQGKGCIKDSIISIFGVKQIPTLIEVDLVKPDENIAADYKINKIPEGDYFSFEFFISSVIHGNGRASADRQFYFINSRPCEPTKIAKLVNECYRIYNGNQYPFVYLNIIVKKGLVDVNVTPDKRKIFLEQEKLLLATVKMSLLEAFKDFPSTYKMNNVNVINKKRSINDSNEGESSDVKKFKIESKTNLDVSNKAESPKIPEIKSKKQLNLSNFINISTRDENDEEKQRDPEKNTDLQSKDLKNESDATSDVEESYDDKSKHFEDKNKVDKKIDKINFKSETDDNKSKNFEDENKVDKKIDKIDLLKEIISCKVKNNEQKLKIEDLPSNTHKINNGTTKKVNHDQQQSPSRNSVALDFTIDSIKEQLERKNKKRNDCQVKVKFRTEISPANNKDSENELQKHISKDMFAKMEIIGQFNYAFLIVRLEDDLFIIDQHACDEKYNFETLQQTTILESQSLVIPKTLQLTMADEIILLENEEVFKKNGFNIEYEPNGKPTERVKLTKLPLSKGYIFGKDDVEEMIFMLKQGADANCRPSRVRGMFASRACRMSVMVGKPLSKSDMRRLVDHMGEIDQPWNCPHGRPTMRHLLNLNLL